MNDPEAIGIRLSDEEIIRLARAKAQEVAERGQYLTEDVSREKQAGPVGELLDEANQDDNPIDGSTE